MQNLSLYPQAFRDYPARDRRYLFQSDDISLFVWISPERELVSFQIDNSPRFFLRYWFTDGMVSVSPRKSEDNPGEHQVRELVQQATRISNAEFPGLFGAIRMVASGQKGVRYHLSDEEIGKLRKIGVWDYSDDGIADETKTMHEKTILINQRLAEKRNPIPGFLSEE